MSGRVIGTRLPIPVGTVGRFRVSTAGPSFSRTVRLALPATPARTRGVVRQQPQPGRKAVATGPARSASFDEMIRNAARREGVDEQLVKAVVEAESGFNPRAVSRAGAKGLMQLMDGTARSLGVKDSFDPAANLVGGTRYLRAMLDRFGSVPLALAAYNAGPGAIEKYGGMPPYQETRGYVDKVLALQRRNQSTASSGNAEGGSDGTRATA